MPYARVKNELPLIPGYSEGSIAYAPDAADAPLNECICYINPVQSGSGDPSPSNVRLITGYTELNLVQKDGNDTVVHTYTTDLGTTVYGGTLDPVSGVLSDDIGYGTLSTTDNWSYSSSWSTSNTNVFYTLGSHPEISFTSLDELSITACDYMPTGSRNTLFNADSNLIGMSGGLTTGAITVRIDKSICADLTAFIQFITDHQVNYCYKKATTTTTQLTPQEVKSLLGSNNFYHDCNGDTKIVYIRRLDS